MFSRTYSRPPRNISFGSPWMSSLNYIQAAEDPSWYFHMHSHEKSLEISFVFEGIGSIYCGGHLYPLEAGDIVIKNPGVSHAGSSDPADPIEQICLIIEDLQIEGEASCALPLRDYPPVLHSGRKKGLLAALFRDILESTISLPSPDLVYVNSLVRTSLTVITDLLKHQLQVRPSGGDSQMMQRVRAYIDEHFAESLSLTSIAGHFHLSEYYLARQFRKYTSFTVNGYIVSCRMGEAQRRLIHEEDRIDEIAARCGYTNLSYFYTSSGRTWDAPPPSSKSPTPPICPVPAEQAGASMFPWREGRPLPASRQTDPDIQKRILSSRHIV